MQYPCDHQLMARVPAAILPDLASAWCVFAIIHWARSLRPVSKLGCHPLHRLPFYVAVLLGFLLLAWVPDAPTRSRTWRTRCYFGRKLELLSN
jgi:hypothetical protein